MYPTCNLACHYLLSPLSECQRLLIEMKGVEFLLLRRGCLPAFGIDKWLTGERFLKVISSYRRDLRKAQSPVTEQILVPIYYTCHFDWKDILTQVFYLFSRVQGNFERTRWILAVHQKDSEREGRKKAEALALLKAHTMMPRPLVFCCFFERAATATLFQLKEA